MTTHALTTYDLTEATESSSVKQILAYRPWMCRLVKPVSRNARIVMRRPGGSAFNLRLFRRRLSVTESLHTGVILIVRRLQHDILVLWKTHHAFSRL